MTFGLSEETRKYFFPTKPHETLSYSKKIKNYKRLTLADKKILVNNFREFYKYVFYFLGLPCPTRDQLFMAEYVCQLVWTQDPLMLEAQRGLAKSLTVQILCSWMLLRNKNEVIVVVSATSARAESFITFVKKLLEEIPLLMHLAPQTGDRASSRKIDVNGRIPNDSPSLSAFGVTSAKTGSRASFIIYDDVEIPENSDTVAKREKLLAGVRDTANLGIAGVFRELCICTPQSSESVYNTMLEDGFSRCIIPAEYPDETDVYNGDLAKHIFRRLKSNPNLVGTATDKRNNMTHLNKQKLKGKARYKLHYMLDTSLSEAERYPLKLSDLIVTDLDTQKASVHIEYSSDKAHTLYDIKHKGFRGDFLYKPRYIDFNAMKEYDAIGMFIDPSGRGNDETAYAITATLGGRIFVLDFGGIAGGYQEETLVSLARIARDYNVNLIQVESNFGDGAFAELLKPVVSRIYKKAYEGKYEKIQEISGVCIEDIRHNTQKEKRIIETLEPIMMQHRLVINKKAILNDQDKKGEYSFTHQLTHITEQKNSLKHDDIIDVVAMGVKKWQVVLAKNTELNLEEYEEEQLDLEIERYINEINGTTSSRNVMDNF